MSQSTIDRLASSVLVPVVRTDDRHQAEGLIRWLVETGIRTIELTTTVPGWEAVTRDLVQDSDLLVGVGTVTSIALAHSAIEAGATFLVSPGRSDEVRSVAQGESIPFLEGGFTPSELLRSIDLGGVAKLYPASIAGAAMMQSVLAVSPGAKIVPSGGIGVNDVPAWLTSGAATVCIGNSLRISDEHADAIAALIESRGASAS